MQNPGKNDGLPCCEGGAVCKTRGKMTGSLGGYLYSARAVPYSLRAAVEGKRAK